MQPTISRFFQSKAPAKATSAIPFQTVVIDLCDTEDVIDNSAPAPAASQHKDLTGIEFDEKKHLQFAKAVLGALDSEGDMDSQQKITSSFTKVKYTPLEQQIIDLRSQHPDTLLMVECGYRIRFFGDDAVIAAKVLSICAHIDHNFMVASVPTFRTIVHCKRLIAAGYKVAIVRQTDTVALRKASKASTAALKASISNTFSRAVAGVFSPGSMVDEDDPAFLGLVQSSGPRTSNTDEGVEESDDGLALGTESDTDGAALDGDGAGTVEGDTDMQSDDVWIACVYEEVNVALGGSSSMGNMRVIATASACVAAHRVQCSYFCGEHACDQLLDHLSILQPKEVIYSDNLSQSVRDALLRVCLNSSGGAAQDQSRYILRLASAPTLQFLTNNVEEQSDAAVGAVYRSEATNWISTRLPFLECKYAVFGLQHYLAELKLESVLYEPRLEVHLPRQDAPARREVSLPSTASSEASGFRLDAVTARDLEVFESSMTGKPLFTSNLAHKFADLVEQQQRKSTASAPAFVSAGGGGKGPLSLFSVINYCRTPFGRRTLRHWLLHPLCSAQAIEARQQAAQWLAGNAHAPSSSAGSASVSAGRHSKSASCWVSKAAGLLASSGDVEKVVGALQHQRILPRGMLKLFDFAVALCEFHRDCMVGLQRESNIPDLIFSAFDLAHCPELAHRVENLRSKLNAAAAGEDAVTDVFTPTAVQDFPQLREFQQEAVATEEALAAELVNIRVLLKMPNLNFKSLRTGPVSKIEHLIEVPVQMSTRVPKEFIRSNCTKQVERYHSPVVLALQDRLYLLRDEIKRAARAAWGEYVLQVRGLVCTPLRAAVEALGEIDALLSLAKLSCIPGYVQPTFGSGDDDGDVLEIIAGRHPMVEKYLERECAQFIPNDVQLRRNFRARSTQVVTGPNMGGKSSYVRMVALICLMAQIGACVPAESAKLCIFDRIFTRMGAGDDLAAGHSTFMSELHRTNYILQRASSRSLVILDELGRGTATNDGLAIAQATLKYVLRRLGSAVLFVTHFPQIADLVEQSNLPATVAPIAESPAESKNCDVGDEQENVTFPHYQAVNIHMGYLEESDRSNVTFLYKVVQGPSRGSYGLNVARLAGIPDRVLALASQHAAWMRSGRDSGRVGDVGRGGTQIRDPDVGSDRDSTAVTVASCAVDAGSADTSHATTSGLKRKISTVDV